MLAALVAAGTLASCGSTSVLDSAGARGHRGAGHHQKEDQDKGHPDKKSHGQSGRQQQDRNAADGKPSTGSAGGAPGDAGTEKTEPVADTGSGPKIDTRTSKPAVSCFDDGTGDMDGTDSAPSYADLRKGCVREDGSQIVLEATTVAAPPARMPDKDTDLAIGFQLATSGKKYYVSAEETENGWTAYLTQGKARQNLSAPQVSGSSIRITVPASALGGAQRLDWRVESSWLKSTLVSTDYAFDDAPNGGGTETFTKG